MNAPVEANTAPNVSCAMNETPDEVRASGRIAGQAPFVADPLSPEELGAVIQAFHLDR